MSTELTVCPVRIACRHGPSSSSYCRSSARAAISPLYSTVTPWPACSTVRPQASAPGVWATAQRTTAPRNPDTPSNSSSIRTTSGRPSSPLSGLAMLPPRRQNGRTRPTRGGYFPAMPGSHTWSAAEQVVGEPVRGERVALGRVVADHVPAVGPDVQPAGGRVGALEEAALLVLADERVGPAVQDQQRGGDRRAPAVERQRACRPAGDVQLVGAEGGEDLLPRPAELRHRRRRRGSV